MEDKIIKTLIVQSIEKGNKYKPFSSFLYYMYYQ